jgi:hypothetical protein
MFLPGKRGMAKSLNEPQEGDMEMLNSRRIVYCTVCLGLIFCLLGCGRKESEPTRREEVKPTEAKKAGLTEKEKRSRLIEKKRAELDNTKWRISVTSLSEKKGGEPKSDTLRFINRKVASEIFEPKGYPASNYTMRIEPDGTVIWETMQTKEGGGVVFWRAECRGDAMKGIISKHPKEGGHEDFSFISISSKKIEETSSQ